MGQCSQKENCCGGAPNEENLDKLGAPILPSDYADQQTMAQMSEEDDADLIDSMQSGGYFERDLGELRRIAKMPKKMEDGVCVSFKSGAKYTGQWKENMRHGKGTMVWSDGAMYEGEWEKNCAVGKGRFTHTDGDIFIGQWCSNMANGTGTYYHHEDLLSTYRGQWHNDIQEGFGVEERSDCTKYMGIFRNGKKSEHGKYIWKDGSECEGNWSDNLIQGPAKYVTSDGRCYAGQWSKSTIQGVGKYTYPDGKCYSGQYAEDVKSGFGIFTWSDGRRYEGFWVGGKQNGHGWFSDAKNGKKVDAQWDNGKFVKDNAPVEGASVEGATAGGA